MDLPAGGFGWCRWRRWRSLIAAGLLGLACTAHAGDWLDAAGRPTAQGAEALAQLSAAAAEGLDPTDYDAPSLLALVPSMAGADAAARQAFGESLGSAVQRYLADLHTGRVDPRRLGFQLPARPRDDSGSAPLTDATGSQPLAARAQAAMPPWAQYRWLREALARYRLLAADPSLAAPELPARLRPGDAAPGLAELARLLSAWGDLPAGTPPGVDRYDSPLVEAVRRFQRRHTLVSDGIVGPATRAALRVPLHQRVRQIELAMERLRWITPPHGRFLAINIPTYQLWAADVPDAARPAVAPPLSMGVIVGKALDTRTPVLQEELRHIVFRPYWNVPRSILRQELLPRIRRDPGVLAREGFELVQGDGDDARVMPPVDANLSLLQQGVLRLRQRPGPGNALGLVKFDFPNNANVYLHGTPATALFHRARRDLSHGCVRVADPLALAAWVLQEQPDWTIDRIEAAMAGDRPLRVALREPVTVLLFYTTAFIAPEDGGLHFADDIYGHDARLDQALRSRRRHRGAVQRLTISAPGCRGAHPRSACRRCPRPAHPADPAPRWPRAGRSPARSRRLPRPWAPSIPGRSPWSAGPAAMPA